MTITSLTAQNQQKHGFNVMNPSSDVEAPILWISNNVLHFSTEHSRGVFQIKNIGSGNLIWNVTEKLDKAWIVDISPCSGKNSAYVWVTVDRSYLLGDNDTGILAVTSNGGNEDIRVTIAADTIVFQRYVVVKFPSKIAVPQIDGILNDSVWTFANDAELLAFGGKPKLWNECWTNFYDNKVQWKAVWSDQTNLLYLAVEVQDDIAGSSDHDFDRLWQDDCIQIFIDGDTSGGEYSDTFCDAQNWSIRRDNAINLAGLAGQYAGSAIKSVVQHGSNANWVLEASIAIYDLYDLNRKQLKIGDIIGWELWYNDSDDSVQVESKWIRDHQVGWGYAGPTWRNADYMQRLEFGTTSVDSLPPHWNFTEQTGSSAIVVLPTSANPNIEGIQLANGDYIGVFSPIGLCCGYGKWWGKNLTIMIWGDNVQTHEIDGFEIDDSLHYRIYRIRMRKEWADVEVDYSQGTGTFSADATMVLNKFEVKQPPTPKLMASPTSLHFGTDKTELTFNISNIGTGTLIWHIIENYDKEWLTEIIPDSGTNDTTITVKADRERLKGNHDTAKLMLISNGGNQNIFVSIARRTNSLPEHWNFTDSTGNYATILLPVSANCQFPGSALQNGDYIGTFNSLGRCCGHAQWHSEDLSITAWGDDRQTPEIDGFQPGEKIHYRVYRKSIQKEWLSVNVEYANSHGIYMNDEIIILSRFEFIWGSKLRENELKSIPVDYNLNQNYPNPFNPATEIRYDLPECRSNHSVILTIYNVLGRQVKILVKQYQPAGSHNVFWDGTNMLGQRVPSGVYVYALQVGDLQMSRKMLLMK